MPVEEQDKSMGVEQIARNISLARQIKASPVDLWGSEWWYWRLGQGDATIWEAVKRALTQQTV
jgi:hypothetical protein